MPSPDAGSSYPGVLAPVVLRLALRDGASAEVSSRVGDVETTDGTRRVVVVRPDLEGVPDAGTFPHEGEELALLWLLPSGQMKMPVVAEASRRRYGSVWVLTPTGAPTREQRRQYFRIPLTLPAVLTPVIDGEPAEETALRATLVEIGEGGAVVCCDGGLPEPGTLVALSFSLEETTVVANAEVLRHVQQPNGRPSAAVRFLDPASYGDRIRRVAFAVQRARARTR